MVQSNVPAEIYQLHILLLQINPPIWRRLHARSDSSIATLHELLQIAFDWSDFHLHRFVIRGKEYGLSRIGGSTFRTDAKKALLSQFHFRVNERFLYEYDFGDLWQHQIRFEGIDPVREKKLYAVCAIDRQVPESVGRASSGLVPHFENLGLTSLPIEHSFRTTAIVTGTERPFRQPPL